MKRVAANLEDVDAGLVSLRTSQQIRLDVESSTLAYPVFPPDQSAKDVIRWLSVKA